MAVIAIANQEEWHAIRAKNVGASESSALFDCQPAYALSRFALFQVKSGRVPAPEVDGPRIRAGKILESGIAELVALEHKLKIERWEGYATSDTTEGMGCTPDYKVDADGRGEGLLEIKWVDPLQHKRTWTDDEPPIHIQIQLQHQLHVTGYRWGAIGALVGDKPMFYPYDYRPKIGAEIEKRIGAFWADVKDDKEPPVDGGDKTAEVLAAMFPDSSVGLLIDMDAVNDFPERWAELTQAILDRRAAEAVEQASKNWLLHKIQDAELIRFGGQLIGTYKSQKRKAYSVPESSSRVLRIKDN